MSHVRRELFGEMIWADASELDTYACGCPRAKGCMCLLLRDLNRFTDKVTDMINNQKLTSSQGQNLIDAAEARLEAIRPASP